MKKYKIWKNTSLLDNFSKNLKFTEKKEDADIILLGSKKININEFKKLKGIFRAGVGQENIPFEACRKKNILINLPSKETKKILFEETANFTISLIFRMAYPNTSIDTPWKKELRNNLKDKTILLIGQGNIGKRVKQKLKNIISVITYDLKKNKDLQLDKMIKKADFISLHIPSNNENKNFFDKKRLKVMKKNSVLINTARADLVNEGDLYKAISSCKIKAAFDVFWEEPYRGKLIKFHPKTFYITPHIASTSEEFFRSCRCDLDNMIKKIAII